jgi:hypothetical protein
LIETQLKHCFITINDTLLCNPQSPKWIAKQAISTSIVNNKIRLEHIKAFLHFGPYHLAKLAISCVRCYINVPLYELSGKSVTRVYLMIVSIYNVVLSRVLVVTLVAVALMRIEVNNHELFNLKPLLEVMRHKCNIRVNAKSTT